MLSDEDLVGALRRHWEYSGKDEDVAHEIYHDDAVLEFPQSGERFEGVENFREWRRRYPADLAFHLRRITHRDDLVVTEYLISYDGAPWMFTVSIMEFRGDQGRSRADLHHGGLRAGGLEGAMAFRDPRRPRAASAS